MDCPDGGRLLGIQALFAGHREAGLPVNRWRFAGQLRQPCTRSAQRRVIEFSSAT